jgi:hypothetical protein
MNDEGIDSVRMEIVDLTDDLGRFQPVVPEPEGHQRMRAPWLDC